METIYIFDEHGNATQTSPAGFWKDNADSLNFADFGEFVETLARAGEIVIGGGASPQISIQTPEFAGGLVPEVESRAACLAGVFVDCLHEETTPEEFAEIKRLNSTPEYGHDSCASHNFVDANMTMARAWQRAFGREFNPDNETEIALWCEAWNLAIESYLVDSGFRQFFHYSGNDPTPE